MVSPGLEFCELLVGEEAGGGRKEVSVVGLCVRAKEGRGAFSEAGSEELRGTDSSA